MSNSTLVDPQGPENLPGDIEDLETSLTLAVEASAPTGEPVDDDSVEEPTEDNTPKANRPEYIPEKFWTGDVETSIAKMGEGYKNLESVYGRMANDLGVQRKLTDKLLALEKRSADLGQEKPQPEAPALPKIDPRELIENPDETLGKYLSAREEHLRKQIAEEKRQEQLAQQEQAFLAKHPNYETVANSNEFVTWVTSSPLRQRAAQLAANGDYTVADELLTEFQALQGNGPAPVTRQDEGGDPISAARRAATESAAQASGGEATSSGKIYRRSDLIALKLEKPEKYSDPRFQDEILRAYAEGRVR